MCGCNEKHENRQQNTLPPLWKQGVNYARAQIASTMGFTVDATIEHQKQRLEVCANCEKLKGTIYDYIKYVEKNPTAMPIYAINVNTGVNKKMLLTKDEEYPKTMIGTSNYKNVKVKATPSIMVIKDKTLVKVISDYNTLTPVTDGKAYFKELMK